MIVTVTLNPSLDRTLHFPSVRIGTLNRATRSRVDLSGKGVNVSMALREFGLESVMTGFVAGRFGRILAEGLREAGYATDFLEVPGETRSNITVIDDASGVTTKLNEPGPTVAEGDLRALEGLLAGRLRAGDLCILSGRLPGGAPDDTYARLVRLLGAGGIRVVLDSSGEPFRLGCAAGPDLVKPNAAEARELLGRAVAPGSRLAGDLQSMLALGPRRVLLSLDARGAAWASAAGAWFAEAPAITEVSGVGAGDALLSGALWAESQGLAAPEALRWGVAAGTAAAMGQGSAMPARNLVREVYEEVRIRAL